jgi:predicted nucleic acid-binding Zn ribbon protein
MIPPATPKACMACGKPVKGRSDKKFCDDYCRNAFNNQLKGGENNYIRNINNILRKNRRILETCLTKGEEVTRASQDKLLRQGFQFRYITHTYTNKKGSVYFFCYDYGYLPLDNGWYLLVKRMKEVI